MAARGGWGVRAVRWVSCGGEDGSAGEIYLDPTVFGNLESFADQVWGVDHE